MPKYSYMCNNCDMQFYKILKVGKKCNICPYCNSSNIERIYPMPLILNKSDIKVRIRKPGELVKEFIEKIDKEVSKEKEKKRDLKI